MATSDPTAEQDALRPTPSTDPATTSALSAGYEEDYPEWSPLKPLPAVTPRPPASDQPPGEPAAQPPRSKPSLETFLNTRSAWMPDMSSQKNQPQPGWLGYSAHTAEQPSSPKAAPDASTDSGRRATGFLTSGRDEPSRERSNIRDLDSEIADAWKSSKASTRSDIERSPAERIRRRRRSGSWVTPLVALLILGSIAFLVWRFVFGPTTFTDPEHGYSFSHPARWKVIDEDPIASQFEYLVNIVHMPGPVIVGKRLDSDSPDEAAMLVVARQEILSSTDGYRILNQIQQELYLTTSSETKLSVTEPAHTTTVAGLDAWRATILIDIGSYSVTVTYCAFLDGNTAYVLVAAATSGAWAKSRETFVRFFDSFNPG